MGTRSPDELKEELRDILVSGLAQDVYLAREAFFLSKTIGEHADAVNQANFGELFGRLQGILSDFHTLCIARQFERSTRYQLRSIPALLDFLETHSSVLAIQDHLSVRRELGLAPKEPWEKTKLSDESLTVQLVLRLREQLPDPKGASALSEALNVLRVTRDKRIAHNERIDRAAYPKATWGQAEALVQYATKVLGVVGMGYVGIVFTSDSEHFLLDYDAQRPSAGLKRLLRKAGVIPQRNESRNPEADD